MAKLTKHEMILAEMSKCACAKKAPAKKKATVKKNPTTKKTGGFHAHCRAEVLKEFRLGLNAAAKEKDKLSKQAALSYTQGLIHGAHLCGVLTQAEAHELRQSLAKVIHA